MPGCRIGLRRLTGNGSALEVVPRRCAIQIHDFTFYFTVLVGLDLSAMFDTLNHDTVLDRFQKKFEVTGIKRRYPKSSLA